MRKHFIVLFAIVAVLSLSVSSAFAQGPSGSSGSSDTRVIDVGIQLLESGDSIEGVFESTVGTIVYGFHASEGDVVTITMTQTSDDLDPFLILTGPRGEVLASDDDSGEESLSSAITDVTLPFDGSYLIIASSFLNVRAPSEAGADTQTFVLTLEGNEPATDDPNYDPERLFFYTGTLEVGGSTTGYSSFAEPIFYYDFDGEEGAVLDFVIDDADFDTLVHVFDNVGSRIAVNDDADGLKSAITDLELPYTGTYFVMVTSAFFYHAPIQTETDYVGGEFTLSVTAK